jgi:short-subunit dehydrogenase
MKLSNKTILITGASSGIGRAVAIKAAQDGATIILAARNLEKLNEVKTEVENLGGTAVIVQVDVTNDESIKNMFLKATEDNRVLDVVFNNAGLGFVKELKDLTTTEIRQMADTNFTGMIIVSKFAAEVMSRQKYGHIIMTSSMAGLLTLPQWAVYCGTKWGITGFADSIRIELKKYNIKVTTIHPGTVSTHFFDKDKANIDVKALGDSGTTAEVVADEVYNAIFTNKQKVIVPKGNNAIAFFVRHFSGLSDLVISKYLSDVGYHEETELVEDHPEFSYIKEVR